MGIEISKEQSQYHSPPHPYDTGNNVLRRRHSRINDDYDTFDQVTQALADAGLQSANLIVGIDFTKSNEWTGAKSFNRRSLHHLGESRNPYEQAISIIGQTLAAFDKDNLIPCYGFGDASTNDKEVFSFYPDGRMCNGFEETLRRYREIVPDVKLAGPTSFAPIIETATSIVDNSGGQYHVLLIIADGQVTRSVDVRNGQLSLQEQDTINAIVKASEHPLSIVVVGVGDGPWDMMKTFDDNIPARAFDNFQFVNFTEIISKNIPILKKETEFALRALMEILTQYKATRDLQLLGSRKGIPERVSLPTPTRNYDNSPFSRRTQSTTFEQHVGFYNGASATVPEYASHNNQACPVCFVNAKNLAFGCGHRTCYDCGRNFQVCPICQCEIATRIHLR